MFGNTSQCFLMPFKTHRPGPQHRLPHRTLGLARIVASRHAVALSPIAASALRLLCAGSASPSLPDAMKLKVEPFNSVKKMTTVVVASSHAAGHPHVILKGTSEVVLSQCSSIIDGTGSVEKLTDAKAKRVANAIDAFACEVLRTLCLAY